MHGGHRGAQALKDWPFGLSALEALDVRLFTLGGARITVFMLLWVLLLTVALVNVVDSPLGRTAECVVPLNAGPELSVAATKSFIGTLSAMTHLTAEWGGKADLLDALSGVGETLEAAWQADWTPAVPLLTLPPEAMLSVWAPMLSVPKV